MFPEPRQWDARRLDYVSAAYRLTRTPLSPNSPEFIDPQVTRTASARRQGR